MEFNLAEVEMSVHTIINALRDNDISRHHKSFLELYLITGVIINKAIYNSKP